MHAIRGAISRAKSRDIARDLASRPAREIASRTAREIARGNGAIPRRDSRGSPRDSLTRRDSVSCYTFLKSVKRV